MSQARDVSAYERYKPPRDADTARNDHVYELQHKVSDGNITACVCELQHTILTGRHG
jgi:hypothetical protein